MERDAPTQPAEIDQATPFVFRVSIEPDEDRYYAEVPILPGCHSWGRTYEEAIQNIKEAVELWLEVKRESGEPIPLEAPDAIRGAKLTIGVLA
jgi:predicted RNase H-like HicB family nuclease